MNRETTPGKKFFLHIAVRKCLSGFTAMGRLLFTICLLTAISGVAPDRVHAQYLGHNALGDFGLLSGTQPDPGLYAALMYLNYDSDTLRDRNGDAIRLDPDRPSAISMNGFVAGISSVTHHKIFGANYGFMIFPSITNNALEAPIFGLDQETDTGLADIYIQPVNLGWHTERADFIAGLGMYAPTGSYDPDASDNLGLGMWSFEISCGTTVYFDKAKTWHFATSAYYEIHTEKEDTDIRVGDILTLEGGLGKSFMEGALTLGVAYYAQWKVTDDDLGQENEALLKGQKVGRHRGYAIGPELTIPIATKNKFIASLTGRYLWETGVRSNLEGNMLVINITFPIPSVPLN